MFQLERQEFMTMRSQNVIASGKRNIRHLPYVFTEHGALMAATILNSPIAVKMSVALIEAFVRLRQELASTRELAKRLAEIEKTVIAHDVALKQLSQVIKPLLAPPPDSPRKKIGFHP
jgi:ABC-type molybdate transport system permease subunit